MPSSLSWPSKGAIMSRRKYSKKMIVSIIKRVEAGERATDVCHELGIPISTFYGRRREYAESKGAKTKRKSVDRKDTGKPSGKKLISEVEKAKSNPKSDDKKAVRKPGDEKLGRKADDTKTKRKLASLKDAGKSSGKKSDREFDNIEATRKSEKLSTKKRRKMSH